MNHPESVPTAVKDTRIHLAKLMEAMDEELVSEMDKFVEWWLERYYVIKSDPPTPIE